MTIVCCFFLTSYTENHDIQFFIFKKKHVDDFLYWNMNLMNVLFSREFYYKINANQFGLAWCQQMTGERECNVLIWAIQIYAHGIESRESTNYYK